MLLYFSTVGVNSKMDTNRIRTSTFRGYSLTNIFRGPFCKVANYTICLWLSFILTGIDAYAFHSYSTTIIVNIVTAVMVIAPVLSVSHTTLGLPNAVLESAMACRVFRQIRLSLITDFDATTSRVPGPHFYHLFSGHIRWWSSRRASILSILGML
jgi:hypothetical protein